MPIVEGLEYFLLSEIFQFKPNCKLKRFIEKYTDTEVHSFTILQIIDKLNHITKVQNMYDENNQSIIRWTERGSQLDPKIIRLSRRGQ